MHLDEPESKLAICSTSHRLNKMKAPHFRNSVEKKTFKNQQYFTHFPSYIKHKIIMMPLMG